MINNHSKSKPSDRYLFKDYQELLQQQVSNISPTHSLCLNCLDYYDIPPCQSNFTTSSGCFPSLIDLDRN